jgi:hypothetical protein
LVVTLSALAGYAALILLWIKQKKIPANNRAAGHVRIPVFPVFLFVNIICVTLLLFGERRFVLPFFFFWLLPAVFLPLRGIQLAAVKLYSTARRASRMWIEPRFR